MGTFILKRKYFADSEKKSDGWSTVGKIATGTAAALGTTALGLRMGRKGTFGTGIQNRVGHWYENAGARLMNSRSTALKGLGMGVGAQGADAVAKSKVANKLSKSNLTGDALAAEKKKLYDKQFEREQKKVVNQADSIYRQNQQANQPAQ